MAPILTNDRILDASKYATANNAEAFMDKKEEKLKNYFFREFPPIFGISAILPPNFTTDTTTYIPKNNH